MIMYRGYVVEFIEYRGDYRIYNPEHPNQTVAYVEGPLMNVKKDIDFHLDRFKGASNEQIN